MEITQQDRRSWWYKQYRNLALDGWYIRQERYKNGVNTYSLVKDTISLETGYYPHPWAEYRTGRRVLMYLAWDVVQAFIREFNFKLRKARKFTCALNYNPANYVPEPGCKITFTDKPTVERIQLK